MTAMWRGYRGGITEQPEDADTRAPAPVLPAGLDGRDDRVAVAEPCRASSRLFRSSARDLLDGAGEP